MKERKKQLVFEKQLTSCRAVLETALQHALIQVQINENYIKESKERIASATAVIRDIEKEMASYREALNMLCSTRKKFLMLQRQLRNWRKKSEKYLGQHLLGIEGRVRP